MKTNTLPLLWLCSPALPIGAFSWSQGLGSAIERHDIASKEDLIEHLTGLMHNSLLYWDLPLLLRLSTAIRAKDFNKFMELDTLVKAGRETKELLDEEMQLGRALVRLLKSLELYPDELSKEDVGYLAAFSIALCGEFKDSDNDDTDELILSGYLFSWLQNQVTVACKSIPLGQTDGQKVLVQLMPQIEGIVEKALTLSDDDLGVSLPGFAIDSALHEMQYSRLYRS